MKTNKKPDVRIAQMSTRLLARVLELFDENIGSAMEILGESESKKVKLNFGVLLDFSDSTAKMTTRITYSQVHAEERIDDFYNPNAPTLPGIDPLEPANQELAQLDAKAQKAADKEAKKAAKEQAKVDAQAANRQAAKEAKAGKKKGKKAKGEPEASGETSDHFPPAE